VLLMALHLWMAASQPQLGSTSEFHVEIRRGRCHTPHHWCGFPLPFRPLGGLPKQPTTGRGHVVIRTGPSRQRAGPRVKTITAGTPIDSILAELPDLTRPAGVQREVRHNTVHHIRTTPGPPVTC
jgi:hypothetical protein